MTSTGSDRISESGGRRPARWPSVALWLVMILGGLIWLIWAWLSNWWTPVTAVDISQLRADTILPAPNLTRQIRQDFVAGKDGLHQIELLLAVQNSNGASDRLEIQLLDPDGQPLATQKLQRHDLVDGQPFNLSFQPQENSGGQQYTLQVGGPEGNSASVWGYDLDTYEAGRLTVVGGESSAEELRFVTRYRLSARTAISDLGRMLFDHGWMMLMGLGLLLMPGILLLQSDCCLPGQLDPLARLGISLALGASLWPAAWMWLTVIGGRWATWSLWLILITGWAIILTSFLIRRIRSGRSIPVLPRATRLSWHHAALLFILALGMAGRMLAVRDLAFPPWVDSSRHALITTLMADSGQPVASYRPLLPIDDFPYHFGFHTLSASLTMMDDQPLPQLLLFLGQLLNGLVPLTTYVAAYLMTRRRSVGLLASFLVALPFFFPAYYATWGRMTQVTAVMILPLALAFTWLLVRGVHRWHRAWLLTGLLAAGLFLVHFRVFLLYLLFAGLTWLVSRGRQGRWLALAGGFGLLLVAPHLINLIGYARPRTIGATIPGYNDFPVGYVTVGWELGFLALAAAAGLLALLAAFRRRSWAWLPLTLMGWVLLTGGLLVTDRLGLPGTTLVNLNSSYIVAFLPLALLLAVVADRAWRRLYGRHWILNVSLGLATGAALTAALIFGVRQQVTILNAVTILAWPPDMPALTWLDKNVAEDATIAVNSWHWLGQTYAGSDGGAWIVPLTGRSSTTPPADYIYSRSLARQVKSFNEEVKQWTDWSDPTAAQWLKEQGVSHIYVGAKGGDFEPARLSRNPLLRQLYGRDGVFIFEIM